MLHQEPFKVSLDSGALIANFNTTASEISGYAKDEVLGKNWFEVFIPNEDLLEVLKVFNSLFYGENLHWEYTNDITCKDGTLKTIKWVNNIALNNQNKPKLIHSSGTLVI